MTPDVSAILVNYNAGPELRRALQSIADELAGRSWEAVVVDNASSDGSASIVDEFAGNARLLRNADNVGFARGVNQGVAASSSPILLIMNPDCRLMPGALATLRKVLLRRADCAIVGPCILDPDGTVQGSARGDPNMFTGLFGRSTLLRRALPGLAVSRRNVVTGEPDRSGMDSVVVDWLSGACMLARREAFTRVGGFDERYFLYWEDADLCRRLRAAGYHVRYVPSAAAVHRVGHSSRRARAAAIRAFHDSAYLYYITHVAPGGDQHRFSRRVRRRLKRILARGLLSARCWLHLSMNQRTINQRSAAPS
jgi:GT2 family glycosyltransferase